MCTKMTVEEMKMLRYICDKTKKNRINIECIWEHLGVELHWDDLDLFDVG